jgi:hypothetical protein
MAKDDSLIEVGDIFHSTMGTDERWATLYFDAEACEFVVIESSDTTGMWPRYTPSGPGPQTRTTLREFLAAEPNYRDKVVRLITEKLGRP